MQWLETSDQRFPPYSKISEEGIIAIGGDLSPKRLIHAYQRGIFPWYNKGEPIIWWCPDPRFVLYPNDLKVSKSMKKILKSDTFTITNNLAFLEVMKNCKTISRKGQKGTWIQEEMLVAYDQLFQLGYAKSVEVWNANGDLVGGLYGIDLGNVFCGESMFSKETNASKCALIHLVQNHDYELIDCQFYTSHLESLGAINIPRVDFLEYLPESGNFE